MKKTLIIIILIIVVPSIYAPTEKVIHILSSPGINPYSELWAAVKFVESGYNPDTINIIEQAYGPGQIRQVKLDDFNAGSGERRAGVKKEYTLTDCMDEGIAREIFMWHCSRFNDQETAARRWNGSGPMTDRYWKKIQIQLNKQKLCREYALRK